MKEKFEIIYPRCSGEITISGSTKERDILKRVNEIKNTEIFKEFNKLNKELGEIMSQKPKLICGKCKGKTKIKDLVLYNVISYSNTMDETRYDDYNVVCPKCGIHNAIDSEYRFSPFKETKEVYKQ